MGILSDIFISTPQDAILYEGILRRTGNNVPKERFERVQYKGFTGLEFSILWATINKQPWDPDNYWLENIQHTDGESWLDLFPDAFVALLAGQDDAALSPTAEEWAKSEHVHSDGADTLRSVLTNLRSLARLAQQRSWSMYLWGSL